MLCPCRDEPEELGGVGGWSVVRLVGIALREMRWCLAGCASPVKASQGFASGRAPSMNVFHVSETKESDSLRLLLEPGAGVGRSNSGVVSSKP